MVGQGLAIVLYFTPEKLAQGALFGEGIDTVSSAPVECLFSFAGHIFSPRQENLLDQPFENWSFLKGNASLL